MFWEKTENPSVKFFTLPDMLSCDISKTKIKDIVNIEAGDISEYEKTESVELVCDVEYEAPASDLEKLVVDAFEFAFEQKIGVNDDFVALGGTSLMSMLILSYLFKYDIVDINLFEIRTPRKIAEYISNMEK